MNIKNFWINLPVKDLERSKAFFRAIGFRENPMHIANPTLGSFFVDEKNTIMMLFPEAMIKQFMGHTVTDTNNSNEILLNIDAQSKEEVDEMAKIVADAGGTIFSKPSEAQGWMYVCGFTDLDGHRWSMLHMDMSKMPK